MSPERSGSAHAHLHLVAHEKSAVGITDFARLLEEFDGSRNDATFALQWLQHDGGQALSVRCGTFDGGLQTGDVIVLAVLETLHHLAVVSKSLVVLWLRGGGKCGQRASVEGLFCCDDDRFRHPAVRGMTTGQLDGSLIGFGTGIAKECLVGIGVFAQPVGECGLLRDVVQIGDMVHGVHLFGDGSREFCVGMPERASGNSADAVQVLLAIGGGQVAALSGFDRQRVSAVGCLDVGIVKGLTVLVLQVLDVLGRNQSGRRFDGGREPGRCCRRGRWSPQEGRRGGQARGCQEQGEVQFHGAGCCCLRAERM
mmetsp:Transcript_1344/g.3292  ORF Transcript_1344/g.3292 Transcript_1344/m.3292 type:complete len:311 (+) Transcript_1344:659-1591(+)